MQDGMLVEKIWNYRYDCWRTHWTGNCVMVIETIIQRNRFFQRRFSIMGIISVFPNWLSLIVAIGALAYITRASWRGKLGL